MRFVLVKRHNLLILIFIITVLALGLSVDNFAYHHDDINFQVKINLKSSKTSIPFLISGNQGWIDFKNQGNCTGEGTFSNPYIIEDLIINGSGIDRIIEIRESNVYFIIRNCTLYNGGAGIYCYSVSNGIFIENYISNSYYGIDFHWYCENNTIIDNQLYNNENTGLFLYGSSHWNKIYQNNISNNAYSGIKIIDSRRNEVIGNTITENGDGTHALTHPECGLELVGLSNNNIILNNCISNSNHFGIYIHGSRYNNILSNKIHHSGESGLLVTGSNNTIKMNIIYNNTKNGVLIGFADSNNFTQNIIRDNLDCGIRANGVLNYNLFYNNTVIRSGVSNAYVVDGTNYWNNSVMGNYWDDYGGVDKNDDGIGDTPYMIISENIPKYDYLPIWLDGPTINVTDPKNNSVYTSNLNPPSFSLDIIDLNLDDVWYTVNIGEEKYFTDLNGILDYDLWINLMNGNITIRFYANDTSGYVNYNHIIIIKDTQPPELIVTEPNEGNIFGFTSPNYNLTITDLPLNFTWYTLDSGNTNYTVTNIFNNTTIGKINQTAWDSLQDGFITIDFYGKDIIRRIVNKKVNVFKDVAEPYIVVNSPIENTTYSINAPNFNLTIIEGNLISTWYTINGGLQINFTGSVGKINQTIWNELLEGTITINFYAKDIAGNIGTNSVIVAKISSDESTPTPPPGIPGYDLYLLIGALSVISAILIRKRVKL